MSENIRDNRKHPILGYHLSGERWRALAKKLCHKINDFYW